MRHTSSCCLRWSIAGLLVALVELGTPANAQAPRYSVTDLGALGGGTSTGYGSGITDLGTLGGGSSTGYAINTDGQVTGEAVTAGGVIHAFLYTKRGMRDLNSMIDPAVAAYVTLLSGKGINKGWIVANGVDSRTGKTHAHLLSKH
jgi:probable HAF family extracellular repeat protein